MNRQAFKQRMQNLKSYREQNPGKGYWDWRVQAYENAGETGSVDERTDHPVERPAYYEPIERVIGPADRVNAPLGTKYSELTAEQKLQLHQSDALRNDKPLESVHPEFDLLLGARMLSNTPTKIDKLLRELNNAPTNEALTKQSNTKLFKDLTTFGKDDSRYVHTQLDKSNSVFSGTKRGAYIKDNKLYPGESRIYDQEPYVWWNKNKAYSELGADEDGFTATIIKDTDTDDLTQVRKMTKPVGQWNGRSGFVQKSEYVTQEPVSLKNAEQFRYNGLTKTYERVKYHADGGETGDDKNPWPNISVEERQAYYDDINPALGFGITDFLGAALTRTGLAQRAKAPKEDENRWKAYLGLPYEEQYAPTSKIRFKGDENYPNRQYQGLSKDAKDEIRKNLIPKVQQAAKQLPKNKWIQVIDQSQGDVIRKDVVEYSRQNHIGDLAKFGIRENNDSGIYEVGDKYDFPWYVPVPDRAPGTELMIRDTIWSDKADPSKYIGYKIQRKADGGETGNDTPIIGITTYNNYGDITHNIATSFSDDTLNLGLPDVIVTPRDNLDLADYVNNRMNNAARFGADIMDWVTPVGDIHQLYDVVNDTRSGDYLSAGIGLAALALPFTPTGLKHVKSQFKYIPSVNKSNVAQQIDAMADKAKQGYEYMTDVANAKNRVFESLKTMPYQYRAKKADKIYGTNYSEVYDMVDQLYNHDFFKLPEVLPKRMEARARMQAKPEAVKKFSKTGEGAGPEDFQLETNTELPMDPEQLSVHELNHYMDYIISRHPDASKNNRMLREIEKSLKKTGSSYFRMGTEQKAYMNQLRQILKKDGVIQNLDEPVSEATLKKYLDSMSDENSIKKAFKQHKNIKEYTKWFNSIPLAAVTAPVVNKGHTKESEDKLI